MRTKIFKLIALNFLWLPKIVKHPEWQLILLAVIFGSSCAIFTIYPNISIGIGIGALFSSLVLIRLISAARFFALGVFLIGIAGLITAIHTPTPQEALVTDTQFIHALGIVETLDYRPGKATRLILLTASDDSIESKRYRFAVRTHIDPNIAVGSWVHFDAVIEPLGRAIVPGGYDFSRNARFQGIIANGFSTSAIRLDSRAPFGSGRFAIRLGAIRAGLANNLLSEIDGQAGALAVALSVGYRNNISDRTAEDLRRSGLSHLLAISGLHMGIVSAFAFFIFELLFAAVPAVALRIMPRKLAVLPAWLVAALYLALSGSSTATIRAFIMVSVAMLAILTDRKVVSLRSVAIAAFIVLVLSPQAALTVGFQMSFAATAGLVAFFELWQNHKVPTQKAEKPSFVQRILRYMGLIAMTSLVAQISIAPVALYHFQAVSVVGILANMAVLPLISLVVMPLLLLSLVLSVFNLIWLVAWPLQFCLDAILMVANLVGGLTFSTVRTLPLTEFSFFLLIFAFVLIIIFRSKFVTTISATAVLLAFAMPTKVAPSVLISQSGKIVAVYDGNQMSISGGRKISFRSRAWRQYWGLDPYDASEKLEKKTSSSARRYTLPAHVYLTEVLGLSALRDACAGGDIVIIHRRYRRYCKNASLILTQEELAERGPVGIILSPTGKPHVLWSNTKIHAQDL